MKKKQINVFKRYPMLDELDKLKRSLKTQNNLNFDTVGWNTGNKDPVTGNFIGSPQNQAQRSREHLKS